MRYEIGIGQSERTLAAVVRDRVAVDELSRFVPAACGEVWAFVKSVGLPKPGRNLAFYKADGFVEVGVEVFEPFVEGERVLCSELPQGSVAHTVHFGPYGGLGEAHRAVRKWCAGQGFQLSGACWELYGHWQESWNADPAFIRTDVFYLLADEG